MNERKFQVLMTAQRLFIEKGFLATSIQDILDEAQIAKGTFYNYFVSKNECLMAILEYSHEEAHLRRKELLVGKDPTDRSVLARQIAVRMDVNREQNLLPLFEMVFYSGDEELRNFVKKLHINEVAWLASRLTDLYGMNAKPYTVDGAVFLLSMLHQLLTFQKAKVQGVHSIDQLIHFVMRRTDALMNDMMTYEEAFLGEEALRQTPTERCANDYEKTVAALQGLIQQLEKEKSSQSIQYASFLLEELQHTSPRNCLIETILPVFREQLRTTKHSQQANEIASFFWRFLDSRSLGKK